jgi:glutamate-1-semialdehyde 2,1-aminomutase
VAAALATIGILADGSVHNHCFSLAKRAADGLQTIADEFGIPMQVARFGSVFVPYFYTGPVETYTDLLDNDTQADVWFRTSMCENGIFMLPTAMKRNHVSAAHTTEDIDRTLDIARKVLRSFPGRA